MYPHRQLNSNYAILQPKGNILTDYFGGLGNQYANVFINSNNANSNITTINQALRHLGVLAKNGQDEFDTLGLDKIKKQPDHLDKYVELADEYGV